MEQDKIFAAIVAAQAEADIIIGQTESQHKGKKYAGLPEVLQHAKPLFEKHGLAVVVTLRDVEEKINTYTDKSGAEKIEVVGKQKYHATILHTSGQSLDLGIGSLPLMVGNAGATPMQKSTAALTTAKRLVIMSLLNTTQGDEEDTFSFASRAEEERVGLGDLIASLKNVNDIDKLRELQRDTTFIDKANKAQYNTAVMVRIEDLQVEELLAKIRSLTSEADIRELYRKQMSHIKDRLEATCKEVTAKLKASTIQA